MEKKKNEEIKKFLVFRMYKSKSFETFNVKNVMNKKLYAYVCFFGQRFITKEI